MLRRKNYTPEEPDNAKTAIGRQLTGYKKLAIRPGGLSLLAPFRF